MNIKNLENEIKFANELGLTLNMEERFINGMHLFFNTFNFFKIRLNLTLAHLKLNEVKKFDQIWFWGKVYGLSSDYYVLLGLRFRSLKKFPEKTFYFW